MASQLQRVPDSFFRPLTGKGFLQFTSVLQISPARMLARVVGRKEQWAVTGVQHDTEAVPLVEADVFTKNPHALNQMLFECDSRNLQANEYGNGIHYERGRSCSPSLGEGQERGPL